MTLKQMIAAFSNDTRIRIETINEVLYEGRIGESQKIDKSNLTVSWCEIRDNVLIVQVEV